ncbi:hypothetical protein HK405_005901 [Cladochytrium tenue]|nr:hypothetical protein HK405_005901 [Cladochytrium tenue]
MARLGLKTFLYREMRRQEEIALMEMMALNLRHGVEVALAVLDPYLIVDVAELELVAYFVDGEAEEVEELEVEDVVLVVPYFGEDEGDTGDEDDPYAADDDDVLDPYFAVEGKEIDVEDPDPYFEDVEIEETLDELKPYWALEDDLLDEMLEDDP